MRRNSDFTFGANGSAVLFAALGDETRLRLLELLCELGPTSISRLAAGFSVTRQAITKHLQVMEQAGVVRSAKLGRESVWQFEQERLEQARLYLIQISEQWDESLERLRRLVED